MGEHLLVAALFLLCDTYGTQEIVTTRGVAFITAASEGHVGCVFQSCSAQGPGEDAVDEP